MRTVLFFSSGGCDPSLVGGRKRVRQFGKKDSFKPVAKSGFNHT